MRQSAPPYDLVVIGSGPGGYAAALTAARRGLRVSIIECRQWGGVCLNVGCIPTKALLAVALLLRRIRQAPQMGIAVTGCELDYAAARARNERIVATLRRGVTDLLRREGIELIAGTARFEDARHLVVERDGRSDRLEAARVVIASGAAPSPGPWAFDEQLLLSYRGLLALATLPPSLLIIGGGVIGCEFASCFSTFGTQVTIVEQEPRLLPMEDPDAARWITRRLEANRVTVRAGATVQRLEPSAHGVEATLSDGARLQASHALIAVGIRPNVESLNLPAASVAIDRGVVVDRAMRTTQPHIAAIGDCLNGHGLAHWASAEGALAVHALLGDPVEGLDPEEVPRCVFTDPELAQIGPRESEVAGSVRVSRLSFGALGKSHCDEEADGFVKLLVDTATDRVRSATIVGANASSLIHHVVLAMHQGLTAKQLARTITAHPTMPEAITEAAASVYGESLVMAARRRAAVG